VLEVMGNLTEARKADRCEPLSLSEETAINKAMPYHEFNSMLHRIGPSCAL
jgi:hypothetical protein